MGRYLMFDQGNTFDFATRADFTYRYEYWNEFVFGGERAERIYGLTKITPTASAEYSVNGLKFLRYVLGTINGTEDTINVADLPSMDTIHAGVDGKGAGILDAKIDTWSMNVEEDSAVKAEFSAIGLNTTSVTANAYNADFCVDVMMGNDVGVTITGNDIGFTRFNLNISNGLEAIFRNNTLPQTLRPTGLEIDGRIRVQDYTDADVVDGSMDIQVGTIGVITLPVIKITEIPPRVTGYDLPETEYAFVAYPGCSSEAIEAVLSNTIKW